jgi:Ca2+-binding RTX toxin-like protein
MSLESGRNQPAALSDDPRRPAAAAAPVNFVEGTDGDDVLVARGPARPGGRPTRFADEIEGRAGNDRIDGGAGNDLIHGDYAVVDPDTMGGPAGRDDELRGGAGADVLYGDGAEGIWTLMGNDRLDGGPGNDVLVGDCGGLTEAVAGDDILLGGAGDDTLVGDALRLGGLQICADDRLFGGPGNDLLYGDTPVGVEIYEIENRTAGGNDFLDGGKGNDILVGGSGNDRLVGGPGADIFRFDSLYAEPLGAWFGSDHDVIADFRSGRDKLDLRGWGLDGAVLDSDGDGRIGIGDAAVTLVGGNLVLDLGRASGRTAPGDDTVTLEGVTSLSVDDLVPLPPTG